MEATGKQRHRHSGTLMQKVAFGTIKLMHDNPLLSFFKDPYKLLKEAGLEKGQKVLEVGCGPGFYTIPAARIVGEEGIVYAVDVNPYAIARVRAKIEKEGIKNVVPMLRNASDTGLPDQCIGIVFMIGLPHIVGGREAVVSEMHHILKPGGLLSLQNTRGLRGTITDELGRIGFVLLERKAAFSLFIKQK